LGYFTMASKEWFVLDQSFVARAEVHRAFVRCGEDNGDEMME